MRFSILVFVLLFSLGTSAQKFSCDAEFFYINKDTFDIEKDRSKQDSLYSFSLISEAIDLKFKKKRESPKSDYFNGISCCGITLRLGPYHWRHNRDPQVLAVVVDLDVYKDSIMFLGHPIYGGLKFDDISISEFFKPYVTSSSMDQTPPGKGWLTIDKYHYSLYMTFNAQDEIESLKIGWY